MWVRIPAVTLVLGMLDQKLKLLISVPNSYWWIEKKISNSMGKNDSNWVYGSKVTDFWIFNFHCTRMAPWVNKNKVQSNYCVLKVIFNLLYLKNYLWYMTKSIFKEFLKRICFCTRVCCVCVCWRSVAPFQDFLPLPLLHAYLCPWARHLIIIASLHPRVKWVPVRAELVD